MVPFDKINQVLFKKWDPLGVGGNENLKDEYLDIAFRLVHVLKDKKSLREIEDILRTHEVNLGVELNPKQRRIAAIDLMALVE